MRLWEKYGSVLDAGRKGREVALFPAVVESVMEGALEEVLPTRFLPGELGYSRGPLGTRIFSRSVLLL